MKPEIDRIMRIVNDYRTGTGGLTESFVRKEIEDTIKGLANVKNLAQPDVSGSPLPTIKKDTLRQWIVGAYGSSLGIAEHWSMLKAEQSVNFANEVMNFIEEHNLLAKDLR